MLGEIFPQRETQTEWSLWFAQWINIRLSRSSSWLISERSADIIEKLLNLSRWSLLFLSNQFPEEEEGLLQFLERQIESPSIRWFQRTVMTMTHFTLDMRRSSEMRCIHIIEVFGDLTRFTATGGCTWQMSSSQAFRFPNWALRRKTFLEWFRIVWVTATVAKDTFEISQTIRRY